MEFTPISFALVVFVTVATPGPTVLLALTNGSCHGVARAGWGFLWAALSDVSLITAALLPKFIILADPLAIQYLALGAMFVAIDIVVMSAYVLLGNRASHMINGDGATGWIAAVVQ